MEASSPNQLNQMNTEQNYVGRGNYATSTQTTAPNAAQTSSTADNRPDLFSSSEAVTDLGLLRIWITLLQEKCSSQQDANALLEENISLHREVNSLQGQVIERDQKIIAELKGICGLADEKEVQNG